MQKLKYFTFDEFDSPDQKGSGAKYMSADFLNKLDLARHYAQIPFQINSGARTPEHNEKVGGKPDSSHLTTTKGGACAADIKYLGSRSRHTIIESLFRAGFSRIGIHEVFIHVDDDSRKDKNVIWLYK
tara:strand:+ start:4382 stop:4765 length:384 start_codon:yes stop_codon:yes gene_type:complete